MVRRSSVASLDGGTESAVYGEESSTTRGRNGPAVKTPWRGGGGRWTVWPVRVVLWVAILVIGYRGIMAIVLNETPTSTGSATTPAAASPSTQFPVTLAEAYALQFGQVYLNFNPGSAGQRQRQLAEFIPASASQQLDPQFGWNGEGSERMGSEQVAGIDVHSSTTAIVTLLASVNGKLMELGVPIYSSGGSLVVSGDPAWLPAPSTVQPPAAQQPATDQNAQNALSAQLPAFFTAYASGDQTTLNRYLAPGVSINGLNGAVRYGSIASIVVPPGSATRDITVKVNWFLPGQARQGAAQLTATYDMSVVDQQSGKWYVEDIRASTQPMGTQ
jgi:conjugative transposon protein TcpC